MKAIIGGIVAMPFMVTASHAHRYAAARCSHLDNDCGSWDK